MRKYLAALLIGIILLTTAGCSNEETGLYSLMMEASLLNAFETSGSVTVSMQGQLLDDAMPDEGNMDEIESVIRSGFEIRYHIQQSKKPNGYQIEIQFRKNGESDFTEVTTITGNEDVMYVKLSELLRFGKPYMLPDDPDEERLFDEIIEKVDILQIDLNSGINTAVYSGDVIETAQSEKIIQLITEFVDVFKDAFRNFSTGMVTRKGSGYELSFEAKDIQPLIGSFAGYLYDNIDTIFSEMSNRVIALTDDELRTIEEVYPSSEITRSGMIAGLEEMRNSVKSITPEDLEDMKNNAIPDEVLQSIDGSSLSYFLGRSGNKSYNISTAFKFKYEDQFTIEMNETAETTKLNSFSINQPDDYITIEEYQEIVKSVIPPKATSIRINSVTGEAVISYTDNSEAEAVILPVFRDGSNYVPLRLVGEAFDESVGWDNTTKTPYIERDGVKTEMKGFIDNGIAYIKVRDFEQLDYMVFWSEYTKEVTIWRFADTSFLSEGRLF